MPIATSTPSIASSIAMHVRVLRNVRFVGFVPSSVAAATPRPNAKIGGTCCIARPHCPAEPSIAKKSTFAVCAFAKRPCVMNAYA